MEDISLRSYRPPVGSCIAAAFALLLVGTLSAQAFTVTNSQSLNGWTNLIGDGEIITNQAGLYDWDKDLSPGMPRRSFQTKAGR